ncbi:MAG: T9SS type A sorting domain-containing protein [FCB group bacterium]
MVNNTNKYFEQAKNSLNAKTLIGEDDTREILAKSDSGIIKSKYSKLLKTKGAIKMITYSSLIGIFTAAMLLFFPAKQQSPNTQYQLPKQSNSIAYNGSKSELKYNSEEEIKQEKNRNVRNNSFKPKSISEIIIPMDARADLPVLVLNDDELANLNIKKTEKGLEFIFESQYNLKTSAYLVPQLESKKYPVEGLYHEKHTLNDSMDIPTIIPYEGWDMKKSEGIYPISYLKIIEHNNGGKASFYSSGNSILINNKYGELLEEEKQIIDTMLINFDIQNPGVMNQPVLFSIDKSKFKIVSKLLPVLVRQDTKGSTIRTIIWFVPTKKLLKKLPERYSEFTSKYIKPIEYVDCNDCPTNTEIDSSKNNTRQTPKSIAGIESLELTREELNNIGIKFENGKYTAMFQQMFDLDSIMKKNPKAPIAVARNMLKMMGYDSTFTKGIIREKVEVDTAGTKTDAMHYNGWDINNPSYTLPLAVTVENYSYTFNKYSENYETNHGTIMSWSDSPLLKNKNMDEIFSNDNGKLKPQIDRLMPVTIIMGTKESSDSSKIRYGEISFWFYVKKEFASLLPNRYKEPILNELALIDDIENGDMKLRDACEAIKGEKSYFDLCRMSSGNINNLSVFPNPISGLTINFKFKLNTASNITIDLYTFNGVYVKTLSSSQINSTGDQIIKLNLCEKLSDGLYLLKISDEKGNQVVQKVIVKN